jgi:tetratricopeptide (TPR) repeat protein
LAPRATLLLMVAFLAVALAQVALGTWASGRPPECADARGRTTNVWEQAKSPELRRYCDLVASALSKLAGTAIMAEAALEEARSANAVLPGHAAPRVLEGRALASLGKLREALAALTDARAIDARALDDAGSLLVWARVLARTGHAEQAWTAYRALLPSAMALSSADRACAAIEAGLVAMARGPSAIDDAVAALRDGMRLAQDDAESVAVLGLALALDRRGDVDEARALLADRVHGDPRTALATARAKELLAVAQNERLALAAVALEATDAAGARAAWQDYLSALPDSPWAGNVRTRLAALGVKRSAVRGSR